MLSDPTHDTSDDVDLDRDEDDDDDASGTELAPVAEKVQRPRARRPVLVPPADPVLPLSEFGAVPARVTHWCIRKRNVGGMYEAQGYAEPGALVKAREWPLSELSIATLLQRWGAGMYEISWVRPDERGGRRVMRGGREVEILAPAPLPAPAPVDSPAAVASSVFSGPLGEALQLMQLFEGIKLKGAESTMQMMQMQLQMGGSRGGGLGPAQLELIMRNNREATVAAMNGLVEPLKAELASLRRELDGDDDETPGIASAALGAAAPLLKGKGGWAQAANFATTNPALVQAALPIVADVFAKLTALFAPPAAPQVRPQARLSVAPPLAPPVDSRAFYDGPGGRADAAAAAPHVVPSAPSSPPPPPVPAPVITVAAEPATAAAS